MKTQNTIIALALFLLATTFSLQAQTLNPTYSIGTAGSADTFKGGYTFAYATSGTPWNGALMSFGGFNNNYDTQLNADYGPNGGNHISFRTKNGDFASGAGMWNPWIEVATSKNLFSSIASTEGGFLNLQNPSKTGANAANEWKLYNMTGGYGNSLQFWAYGATGFAGGPRLTILDGGNVGIGTQTPSANLEISKLNSNLLFDVNTNSLCKIVSKGWNANIDIHTFQVNGTENINQLMLNTNGKVGIGTIAPAEKLEVAGNIKFNSVLSTDGRMHLTGGERLYILNKDGLIIGKEWGGNGNLQVQGNTIIDGNVGIGTTAPDAKLTVNGQIHTKEVRIDILQPMTVPDYVFANDYKLKTLNEVDQYVKANNHLPEIPSAKEMAQNGMLVSEMNLSLLKKIEELTLYAIEQQKKLEAQNKDIEVLKAQNKQLESLSERLSKLEKK
jgi:hypothetical protein